MAGDGVLGEKYLPINKQVLYWHSGYNDDSAIF